MISTLQLRLFQVTPSEKYGWPPAEVRLLTLPLGSGRRRGHPRRPPTPPYVRFRIRRFLPTDQQRQRAWFR